jgi:hypothetical protein
MSKYAAIEQRIYLSSGAINEVCKVIESYDNIRIDQDTFEHITITKDEWKLTNQHDVLDFIENIFLYCDGVCGTYCFDSNQLLKKLTDNKIDFNGSEEEYNDFYKLIDSLDKREFYYYNC